MKRSASEPGLSVFTWWTEKALRDKLGTTGNDATSFRVISLHLYTSGKEKQQGCFQDAWFLKLQWKNLPQCHTVPRLKVGYLLCSQFQSQKMDSLYWLIFITFSFTSGNLTVFFICPESGRLFQILLSWKVDFRSRKRLCFSLMF